MGINKEKLRETNILIIAGNLIPTAWVKQFAA
jgi:hypothetical protein